MSDFMRHRIDVGLVCGCGHVATLPFLPVVSTFSARGWPTGLGAAAAHFRCSRCGGRPVHIGPYAR